jgi:hypothetical protein
MLLTTVLVSLMAVAAMAQTAEVLYFKANLACCQAKACASLEKDIQTIITKNFASKVTFTEVKLDDAANKATVEKHKAKSQTVVMVVKKKKKENVVDLSDIVRKYQRSGNKEEFEKELVARIKEGLK